MRRATLLSITALLALAAATWLPAPDPEERLQRAVEEAGERLAVAAQEGESIARSALELADDQGIRAFWGGHGPSLPDRTVLRLYHHDTLAYWSASVPDEERLDTTLAAHVVLSDGIYLHSTSTSGPYRAQVIRRIWRLPPFENRYLRNGPEAWVGLSGSLELHLDAGMGEVFRDPSGEPLGRILWAEDAPEPEPWPIPRWVWWIIAGVAALALMQAYGRGLAVRRGAWPTIALLAAVLVLLRAITIGLGPLPGLSTLPLFDPALYAASILLPSLGDLMINAMLLLFLVAILHDLLGREDPAGPSVTKAFLSLAILLVLAGWIDGVLIGLVNDSSVGLDLYHVESFDRYSWVGLGCVALLLGAWMLLADALVRRYALHLSWRQLLLGATLLYTVNVFLFHQNNMVDTILMFWTVPLLVLLLHFRRQRFRTVHGLLMLAFLAIFAAHVLDRYTLKREARDRLVLAENLVSNDDPIVDLLFRDAVARVQADPRLRTFWQDSTAGCTASELDRIIRQEHFTGYWDRYALRFSFFDGQHQLRCTTSPDAAIGWELLKEATVGGMPTPDDPLHRSARMPGEEQLFLGIVPSPEHAPSSTLVVEMRSRLMPEVLGFPELLLSGDRPLDRRLDRYARARYESGALADLAGPFPYPLRWDRPMSGLESRYEDGGFDHLAWGDPQGTLVVLGLEKPTLLDRLTTFSYLFTFFTLLSVLVLFVQSVLRQWRFRDMGLGAKLRAGILGFAGLGLFLFALGTRQLLSSQYEQRAEAQLMDRTRSALVELQHKLQSEPELRPEIAPYLDHLLVKLSNVFFTDLTLYGPDGVMLATSRARIFETGLLGDRMDPRAFRAMAINGTSSFLQEEHIGDAAFRTSYAPFRNEEGRVLAYLALPYFAKQAELEKERAGTMVAIVNLFVLLFVLSVIAAAFIANWTTRPLRLLEQGLERIGLGSGNEPIRYRGHDELGRLVAVYNRKVAELRASAERLARSERESAWREMAQQVAHEIKNPLTPMKLSMQHFQRTWDPDAPDAAERLARFSSGMVQQIDALSGIASAFSDFARMPKARPEQLDLGEVVHTAVSVFHGTPDARLSVQQDKAEPLPIRADREQLLRVFNNLLKNALQAVPEGRSAEIRVTLQRLDDKVIARVQDNGTGIPEADRDRIFRPNFTTKSSGMGLGLAMVMRIVEAAGGNVSFTSREGEGATFIVELPLSAS